MHAEIYARWLRSERATQNIIRNVVTNGSTTHGQQTSVEMWSAGLRHVACRDDACVRRAGYVCQPNRTDRTVACNQRHGDDGTKPSKQGICNGYVVCVRTRDEWPTDASGYCSGDEERLAFCVSTR